MSKIASYVSPVLLKSPPILSHINGPNKSLLQVTRCRYGKAV